jgi:hypothetical protein
MALAGIALVPLAIEVLGHEAELDDEVGGEVLRPDLAPLFLPQAEQGGFVVLPMMMRASEPPIKEHDSSLPEPLLHMIQNMSYDYLNVNTLLGIWGAP